MKKTLIVSAFGLAAGGLLSAQGLYNIMPFDDEPTDSLPLTWTSGASIGWDSNASPQFTECEGIDAEDVGYLSGFVQANFVSKTPQTTIDLWGRAGATYYLDEIAQSGGPRPINGEGEDLFPQLRGGVNFVHRVNETLRLRSRNNLTYEQEPDYDHGIASDRRQGSYLRYSSDNSVGYRWSERLGTNTGYRLSGVTFDEVDRNDYVRHLFYNQFRYRSTPSTVWTAAYRHQSQGNDNTDRRGNRVSDSTSHYFLLGAEHELSPTTVVVVRAGAQVQEFSGGVSNTSPYVEASLRAALSPAAQVRVFARYGLEDRNRIMWTHDCWAPVTDPATGDPVTDPATGDQVFSYNESLARYDERQTFRLGLQGSYVMSPKLTFFGGVNILSFSYDDVTQLVGASPASMDEKIININGGASYEVADNIFVTGSYNYTKSSSDADIRDYDRSRVQIGVQSSF